MTDNPNYAETPAVLAWVDVETNGLDPNINRLLEIAVLVTDIDLNELDETGYQATVLVGDESEVAAVRDAAVPYVQDMHDRTGLWGKLSDPRVAKPLGVIDAEALQYVKQFAPAPRSMRLAGNSVRLDLNFTETYLPEFYSHLHYRMFDVTSISAAARWWTGFPTFKKRSTHSAFDDIRESLAEARAVRDFLNARKA